MKKRVMALICAALLVGSMSMTAFATNPSVQAGIVTGVDKIVDSKNNVVTEGTIVVEEIKDNDEHDDERDYIKEEANMKKELEKHNAYEEGMKVLDVRNVEVKGDKDKVEFPVTITFKVNGIKAGDKVILLHYVDEKTGWEKLDTTTGEGTVTATFNSFSPVAFIKVADAESPKTGEPMMAMVAIAAIVIGAAGVVVTSKKRA